MTPRTLPVLAASPRSSGCGEGALVAIPPRPACFDRVPGVLVDPAGRRVRYVRLSVTDRCDLACTYCMPPHGEREHARASALLSFDEVAQLARVLAASGVERLRFTGGEPLVRRDLPTLVARAHAAAPTLRLALTTNGTRLAHLARALRDAGLGSVNVSVDSLDPERFHRVTRGGDLALVRAGVEAALEAGLEVKVNAVVLGAEGLAEVPRLTRWAWAQGVVPRFIELMPIGEAARLPQSARVPGAAILEALAPLAAAPLESPGDASGPARYLVARDGSGRRVGLIAATTEPFCDRCNRIRITASGVLQGCLGHPHGVALAPSLREGEGDLELAWALHAALGSKAAGHRFADAELGSHHRVGMSLVGG
ncbi:MAG: GTP 3',8-cyclase MoaA [Sandaracinaceae bacterium]